MGTEYPLRSAREAQGLGLRETAELAGIDPAHLSRAERGLRQLSVASLARLAAVIGLGPRDLAQYLREYEGARS